VLRIVVTGPESSGKTTLAEALAQAYGTAWAEEAARGYLSARSGTYEERDLAAIARAQLLIEEERAAEAKQLLVCDTDLLTIRIWGEEKYGRSDAWIVQQTLERPYGLWLLCAPDMPWEPDPLRENPHDRERLFEAYAALLGHLGKPHLVLRGPHAARMAQAKQAIDALLAGMVR
jgi:NadR type nicotinamide-nucleotide adenylyltransferase